MNKTNKRIWLNVLEILKYVISALIGFLSGNLTA